MVDRLGHVYYWSFNDELWVVMRGTPALLESGGTVWQCLSLETGAVKWFPDHDVNHMFARIA